MSKKVKRGGCRYDIIKQNTMQISSETNIQLQNAKDRSYIYQLDRYIYIVIVYLLYHIYKLRLSSLVDSLYLLE